MNDHSYVDCVNDVRGGRGGEREWREGGERRGKRVVDGVEDDGRCSGEGEGLKD